MKATIIISIIDNEQLILEEKCSLATNNIFDVELMSICGELLIIYTKNTCSPYLKPIFLTFIFFVRNLLNIENIQSLKTKTSNRKIV